MVEDAVWCPQPSSCIIGALELAASPVRWRTHWSVLQTAQHKKENVKKRGAGLEPQGTICGLSLIHGSATMHLSRHHAS